MECIKCKKDSENGKLYCIRHRREKGMCPNCGVPLTERKYGDKMEKLNVCERCTYCEDVMPENKNVHPIRA